MPDLPPSGMSSAHEMHHYLGRDDDRGGPRVVDTQSIGSAYDRYLQSSVITEADNSLTFLQACLDFVLILIFFIPLFLL